jgi:hypothetical protein
MRDEGIVQPVSKEMDKLSRRLHQMWVIPGEIRGIPRRTGIKWAQSRERSLLPACKIPQLYGLEKR